MAFTTSTVTVWPIAAAKSARVTPTLLNHLGGLLSNFQLSTFPSLPFASMKTTIWGLVQSTLVRDPLRVTLVFMSKIAEGEWCAHKAAAGISIAKPRHTVKLRFCMWSSKLIKCTTALLKKSKMSLLCGENPAPRATNQSWCLTACLSCSSTSCGAPPLGSGRLLRGFPPQQAADRTHQVRDLVGALLDHHVGASAVLVQSQRVDEARNQDDGKLRRLLA